MAISFLPYSVSLKFLTLQKKSMYVKIFFDIIDTLLKG